MKDTKKKHLKLWMLLLLMIFGSFVAVNGNTTTVQASSYTVKSNGRIYLEKHNDYSHNTVLYQKVSGRYRQVAKSSNWIRYRFSYGKKMYFTSGGEGSACITYTYTVGKKGFKLERRNMMLTDHRGRYAIGYITLAGDPSPSTLCCYDLVRKKMTRLGRGCDIKFIGNKIYYAYSYNRNTMQVIRRNANGSGKKVLKTIRGRKNYILTYMFVDSPHKVRYDSYKKGGFGWSRKTVRF